MTVQILVPVSGGKDSQAALQLAVETYGTENVRGLFCNTNFEHPETYLHIERMKKWYGVEIVTVCDGSVDEQVLKHGQFPLGGARFCTEELKIWPTKRYCRELALAQGSRLKNKKAAIEASTLGGFEVWYGMRSDESPQRKKRYAGKVNDELYPPHEVLKKYPKYLSALGVVFRLCILDWSEEEVKAYVGERLNPLYQWFDRVGCFPCQASGDGPKHKAYEHDAFGAFQFARVMWLAKQTGANPFIAGNGPSCAVCTI